MHLIKSRWDLLQARQWMLSLQNKVQLPCELTWVLTVLADRVGVHSATLHIAVMKELEQISPKTTCRDTGRTVQSSSSKGKECRGSLRRHRATTQVLCSTTCRARVPTLPEGMQYGLSPRYGSPSRHEIIGNLSKFPKGSQLWLVCSTH